jgi:Na+-driven multidrug efflux pump
MFILMPIFGINQAAQPILGYNYGAKNFGRVRRALLMAILGATFLCTAGFVLGEFFPDRLILLFAPDGDPERLSPALLGFAPRVMRIMMIMLPVNGFQIVATNFFVVTGRPKTSIFLSMLRQFIALIPCMLVFGKLWGLWGVVAAMPVADGFSFICTGIMTLFELGKLKKTETPPGASHA